MNEPAVFIILGMHKSGTSLVAQALHRSGIRMVPPDHTTEKSYDQGEKFEWNEFKEINYHLLGCGPDGSLDVKLNRPLREFVSNADRAARLIAYANSGFRSW